MGEEKTKQQLVEKAKLEELRDPPRNARGGSRNSEPAVRDRPRTCDLIPGGVYAVERVEISAAPPSPRGSRTVFGSGGTVRYAAWDYEHRWSFEARPYFRVRLVCLPTKNSKIALIEVISTGKLDVIDVDGIRYIQPGWVAI